MKLFGTHKRDSLMMDIAERVAMQSYDSRTKVGAVITNGDQILGYGYNGTPAGFNNECKDEHGNTLPTVVHAEINALAKVARSNSSTEGATLYVTLSPCLNCALSIVSSGISEVIFKDYFRLGTAGIDLLQEANIAVRQFTKFEEEQLKEEYKC
jgi:dCMP deaminase